LENRGLSAALHSVSGTGAERSRARSRERLARTPVWCGEVVHPSRLASTCRCSLHLQQKTQALEDVVGRRARSARRLGTAQSTEPENQNFAGLRPWRHKLFCSSNSFLQQLHSTPGTAQLALQWSRLGSRSSCRSEHWATSLTGCPLPCSGWGARRMSPSAWARPGRCASYVHCSCKEHAFLCLAACAKASRVYARGHDTACMCTCGSMHGSMHYLASGSRRVCTQVFNCAQLRLTLVGPQVGAPRCARAVPGSAAAVRLFLSGWAGTECVSERAVLTGAGCPRSRGSCRTASRRWRCRRTSRSPPCARTSWSASACTGAPRGWHVWPVCAAPYHTGCPRLARRSSASGCAGPAPQRAALHTRMHGRAPCMHGAHRRVTSGGRAGRQCRDAARPPNRHPAAPGARRAAAEPGRRAAAAGLGGRRVRRAPGAPPPRLRPRASRPGRACTAPESCAALHRALRLLCALLYR